MSEACGAIGCGIASFVVNLDLWGNATKRMQAMKHGTIDQTRVAAIMNATNAAMMKAGGKLGLSPTDRANLRIPGKAAPSPKSRYFKSGHNESA